MKVGSLFAGIGGFDLGLERAGMEIAWQVEIDPFCCKVLEKHWPGVRRYGDIRQIRGADLEPVDLVCGGPPCQPVSLAGQRRGKEDDRWLWPEAMRLVEELHPRWCLFENPLGIISMGFDGILAELEDQGYEGQAFDIPACGVDSPQLRYRVWIVAHSERTQRWPPKPAGDEPDREDAGWTEAAGGAGESGKGNMANAEKFPIRSGLCPGEQGKKRIGRSGDGSCSSSTLADTGIPGLEGQQGIRGDADPEQPAIKRGSGLNLADPSIARGGGLSIQPGRPRQADLNAYRPSAWSDYEWIIGRGGKARRIKSGLCGVAHGIPHRVDRLRALGNAVVPEEVEIFGRMIMEIERQMQGEVQA